MWPLTPAQRLRLLERRIVELNAWRNAYSHNIVAWTLQQPGQSPIQLALGAAWGFSDGQNGYNTHKQGPVMLRAEITVPADFAARPLELELDLGGEGMVRLWQVVAGQTAPLLLYQGGLNPFHRQFTLFARASGGERLRIEAEVVPKGLFGSRNSTPSLALARLLAPEAPLVELITDLRVLVEAVQALEQHEIVPLLLAAAEQALAGLLWPSSAREYLARIPDGTLGGAFEHGILWSLPEIPPPEPLKTEVIAGITAARANLKQSLARLRDLYPAQGRIALSGHAHIDLAWLWPISETRRKIQRTFATVLALMKQDPELTFNQSSAQAYAWLETDNPALFAEVQARVREGRWEVIGGMWVEPDGQMPSGESWARQLLYGQGYFKEKFGVRSSVAWLPDTFGFHNQLPQLLKLGGIDNFFTTKLRWNETTVFPHDLFLWQGLDGSRVLAHCFWNVADSYNAVIGPKSSLGTWKAFGGKSLAVWLNHPHPPESLLAFGYGDGGGGPSREMLASYQRSKDYPALPKLKMSRVDDFYARLPRENLPLWQGELYLELHRGTLTTQSRSKRLHRELESCLIEAETLWALRWQQEHQHYPGTELETLWKVLLLHQFHDILPGSSIREVYEDSERELQHAVKRAEQLRYQALEQTVKQEHSENRIKTWTVVNPCFCDRRWQVFLPGGNATDGYVIDAERPTQRLQAVDGGVILEVDGDLAPLQSLMVSAIPAFIPDNHEAAGIHAYQQGDSIILAGAIRVEIAPDGTIAQITGQQRNSLGQAQQALRERGNQLWVYRDVPREWEAWDINPPNDRDGFEITHLESLAIIESGPIRASVMVKRRFRSSTITQIYRLWAASQTLEILTAIDWQEKRLLLKAKFPTSLQTGVFSCETAFGVTTHPTHSNSPGDAAQFEVAAQRWVSLSDGQLTLGLVNDGKYGHRCQDQCLEISLLRGSMYPDPTSDLGLHQFNYGFVYNEQVLQPISPWLFEAAANFSHPLRAEAIATPFGWGALPFFAQPLHCASLKRSEDGNALILRFLATPNDARRGLVLHWPGLVAASRVNILEERQPSQHNLLLEGETLKLSAKAFEIVTLRLEFGRDPLEQVAVTATHPPLKLTPQQRPAPVDERQPVLSAATADELVTS
jgi:alpha-mannosidase